MHVVMFSSGIGSWAAAKRVAAQYGTSNLILLFADTLIEDEDNYRFLDEAAKNVGGKLVKIADGRTPWEVFRDERYIGNSRVDPCSKILKRELIDRWMTVNFIPADTNITVGIGWDEVHRLERMRKRLPEWNILAPLTEPPYLEKAELMAWAEREGLKPPRLYSMGFPHANCGGFCIKAGQAQFRLLLEKMPERYAYHERMEQEMREYLGRNDIAILSKQINGRKIPLTLTELRQREQYDKFDWGGCGCFVDQDGSELEAA